MTSKIFLNNIHIHAFHGVMPQERMVGADFLVSVEASADIADAIESDELTDTVSYANMADIVRSEMAVPSQLLEHVCGRIGHSLLHQFPTLSRVTMRITKVVPPIVGLQCDGAGVEVTMDR